MVNTLVSNRLKFVGIALDSYGSNFDSVIVNGVETKIRPIEEANNPNRLRRLYTVSND